MTDRLLCRFGWYRRLRGGTWGFGNGRWVRVQIEVIEPIEFFTDDLSLRDDYKQFLIDCEKEHQRERT